MYFGRFKFFDPGPLVDRDLELVPPGIEWVDEVLASCSHPLTVRQAPTDAQVTREQLVEFVLNVPFGRESGDPIAGKAPQYHFWMRLRPERGGEAASPEIRMAGAIGLRVGSTESIEMYYGHFGYHVYPAARGRGYAARACRLLLPLARRHGFKSLWITCNPDNIASRRTCETLGARLIEVVPVPDYDVLYARGETHKCRYRLDLRK